MDHLKKTRQKHKQIKKICTHANPLFEKWLLEWAEEANQRHSNMKYNFQKAIASLRRYPLPLHSGKDCLLLAHFGEKICKLIDKKLEEHIKENGPVHWDSYIKVTNVHNTKKVQKRKRNPDGLQKSLAPLPESSGESISHGSKNQQYVPAFRSGAYALLLSLFNATMKENYLGFLKKQDLIDSAQEFCDSSFRIPLIGSHYTAWSSMSTLINKNLVLREGNPSRYSLTEAGKSLGHLLTTFKNSQDSQNVISLQSIEINSGKSPRQKRTAHKIKSTVSKAHCKRGLHNISSSESEAETDNYKKYSLLDKETVCKSNSSSTSYNEVISLIDDDDACTIDDPVTRDLSESPEENYAKDVIHNCSNNPQDGPIANAFGDKEVSLKDENKFSKLLIEYGGASTRDLDERLSSGLEGWKFTYIDSLQKETPLKDNAYVKIDQLQGSLMFLIKCKLCDLLNSGVEYEFDESRTAPPGYTYAYLYDFYAPNCSKLTDKSLNFPSAVDVSKDAGKKIIANVDNSEGVSSYISIAKTLKKKGYHDVFASTSEPSEIDKLNDHKVVTTSEESIITSYGKSNPAFTFYPNQYKIILCVDNNEVTGGFSNGKKGSKDIIINELKTNGVNFDVRKLNIGDFLWICQENNPTGNKYREVVLPYVVERKRMDDLASSIRDGRFREQKYRLKKSGLKNLIYLVEEIGSNHLSIPLSTCEQAFTNTQIIDNFTVKVTADQRESAAYLTVMTRYLQGKFKNNMIKCLEMKNLTNEDTLKSLNLIGPSFEEFNSFSMKNQILSVQDMFAKHLLQLFGNSVDKVTAIISKYPTPALLRDALEKQPTNTREELLSTIKCPKSGRVVGSTISTQLARLYTWSELN